MQRHWLCPWIRKIPGGGHGTPLQDSCLVLPPVTNHSISSQRWVQSEGGQGGADTLAEVPAGSWDDLLREAEGASQGQGWGLERHQALPTLEV